MIDQEKNKTIMITLPKELVKSMDDFIAMGKDTLGMRGFTKSNLIRDAVILYFDFIAGNIKFANKKEAK